MATLQQRLYPLTGQATLADIPWLYGQLSAARQRAAQTIGQTSGQMPGMKSQQLPALSGGGAASIGTPLGGRPVPSMPNVEAVSSPNTMRQGIGMDDRGRSEGGGYGGGNILGESDRYTDMARRGTAPLTLDGVLTAIQNAAGLIQGPISTGISSIATLSGNPIPGMPGIQDIPGYRAIPGKPRTLQEYLDAQQRALSGPSASRGDRLAARNTPDRIENVVEGGWVDPALGARMRGAFRGGGPRSSYGGGRDGGRGGAGERGGRGAGLGGQGSQAGDIGGQAGRGGRRAY